MHIIEWDSSIKQILIPSLSVHVDFTSTTDSLIGFSHNGFEAKEQQPACPNASQYGLWDNIKTMIYLDNLM